MKFPILFASNATDFFNLGLGPMTNTLEATVTEERNGSFYFDAKVIIDDQCYPLLEENRIIRADASPELLDQRFRIKKITDNHDGTAQVYAEHVSYITQELSLKPQVTVSGTGSTAINVWKNAIIDSNPLTVDSNIPTSTTTSWRIDEVENARQALGGVKGSLLDMWGGEYRFDNYHISLLQKRGTTANVLLAYGRNITDFEQERNITDTYNSLYPYAIYTDDNQKEHLVTLPTFFVDAENIANFPNRKAFPIDFSDQFKQDEVPTAAKLKSLAQSYIKSNDIGIPKVSIKVSFIDLAKTTDYADIAPLEKLNLCDEVRVIYPKLNVNTTAKVVRVVWNVLAETYDQIEIGEKRVSLSDKLNEQSQSIKEANTQANTAISASNNKNTVFYGLYGTDGLGEPVANKVGDLWFKPDGEETVMLQWDGTLWRRIINTGKLTELDQAFEESNKKIEQAEEDLAQAKLDLTQNGKDIEQNKLDILDNIAKTTAAKTELDQAKTDLVLAAGKIDANKTYMDQVKAQADEIAKQADDATTIANLSKIIADEAKKDAEQALNDASSAVTNANQAKSNASTALTNANQALTNAANVDQKVKTEVSRIDGELSSKASQTTVDTLNKTVSNHTTQITQNQNDIKIKANQSAVDTLNQTVSNQGASIETNAKAISLKASQTDVNAISGRVSSTESSIKVNADSIKNLVTKTDGTNTKVTSLEQNVDGFKQTVAERFDNQIVGGDNLIFNSGDFVNLDGWTFDVASNVTSGSWSKSLTTHSFWYNSKRNIIKSDLKMKNGYGVQAYLKSKRFEIQKNATYTLTLTAFNNSALASVDMYLFLRKKGSENDFTRYFSIAKDVKYRADSASAKSFTFNTPDMEENEAYLRIDNNGSLDDTSTASFLLCEVALRQGNIVQNWSPSAKETNDRVSTVEQNIDGFKQTVAQTYSTKGELSTTNTKVTSLEQNVDGFKQTVAQTYTTKDEFGNILVVGDNLIPNSGDFQNLDNWRTSKGGGFSGNFNWNLTTHEFWYNKNRKLIGLYSTSTVEAYLISTRFPVKQNTTYTIGITAFNSSNLISSDLYLLARESTNTSKDFTKAIAVYENAKFSTSEASTKYVTFTTPKMSENEAYIRIDHNGTTSQGTQASLFICEVSMREGNVKAGWTPATGNEITQIKQTINTIDLNVVKKDKVVSSINLNPEGIRLKGSLIYLDGTSYIANGVITNAHIADATITSASIADLAVTTAKIAKLAITDALIANATITAASIADLAITSAKIGNLAVTNAKIGDLAVNGAKIANAAITEAKIGDAAIVNAHIKDATIESAKIKSISADKITVGTLNGANVNIINLNANNITSGNINGINITGSTITSQKGSSKIVLDGGALSWYVSNGLVGSIYTNEDSGITQASWDVYDAGYFSIRGKGSYDGEVYMRYGWAGLSSIVSGKVSIVSKNKNADRSTSLELNNSQIVLTAGSGSGSSYRQGQIQVGAYGTSVTGGMTISGGLSVTGSKNAIHQVDGQWYATPAYETAESYLGDIGSTTTNNDSMVLISIDNLFCRIVNTSLEYQVFVSSYGSGHVWVEKRMQNAFVVRSSEPNTKFAWEIKAKRKGYEQERLVKHSLIA